MAVFICLLAGGAGCASTGEPPAPGNVPAAANTPPAQSVVVDPGELVPGRRPKQSYLWSRSAKKGQKAGPRFSGMIPEVDTGTFAARFTDTTSGPVRGIVWRSPSVPDIEVWALDRVDQPQGYARPSPTPPTRNLLLSVLAPESDWSKDDEKSDPTVTANMLKFLAFAKRYMNTQPENLTVYRLGEVAAAPSSPVSDGRGCLKPGLYVVKQLNHPTTASQSTELAWAWHPSNRDDYEVWLFREPVNSDGFMYPGHMYDAEHQLHYTPAQLLIQWTDFADSVADLDGFYQWVFLRVDVGTVLREHAVVVEKVQ